MNTIKRIVVIRGVDAGKELVLSDGIKLVGRSSDADLRLNDRSVSRYHFHVRPTENGVNVRLCGGSAKPIIYDGQQADVADLKVGESMLVGATELLVAAWDNAVSDHCNRDRDRETTTIHALLTGPAVDVRGLAALFELNKALTDAADVAAVRDILASWTKMHAACDAIELYAEGPEDEIPIDPIDPDDPNADERIPLVETPIPDGGTRVLIPVHGTATGWFAFYTHIAPYQITDSLRRLLVLGTAISASRMTQLSVLSATKEEGESFRKQAMGSARAFLGSSESAVELIRLLPKLAASDISGLLLGETGAGKSFVARLIHESGPRRDEPFRVVNCASIPETLFESQLFGHERGAFTGAVQLQYGILEAAGRGTVLLDEIGELSLASQAKLLGVLEEKRFERLGSNRPVPLRARVLAATNRDLESMISQGTFRSDLYFRIAVVRVTVPPLRERGDAIALLANEILADFAPTADRRIEGFSPEAIDVICNYPWPGNVRELRNAIERAVVTGDGPFIRARDLPVGTRKRAAKEDPFLVRLPADLRWLERQSVEAALQETGGNQTKAAALLGINRNTLASKMRDAIK